MNCPKKTNQNKQPMKNQPTSADRERAIFKTLNAKFPGKVVSPGYLRVEQTLLNSTGKYKFNIKKIGGENVTELKLDRNDLFVVSSIGIYLLREETAKAGGQALQTYPNQTVFAGVVGFDPKDLETIYNGFLYMKVSTLVNIESLSMQNFRRIPQTQQSSATNYSQYDLAESTYKPGSLIELHGTSDIEINVEYPSFTGITLAAVTAGFTHKLVFMPQGYLIKGGAKSQN